MLMPRVIPCLLLDGRRLVKTVRFQSPKYVGDPVNAVRIFNEKEVDELIVLDIAATRAQRPFDENLVRDIASEAFMPVCFGGGVHALDDFHRLFELGIEKVAVNAALRMHPDLIKEAAKAFGSQSIVGSIDVRAARWPRRGGVFDHVTRRVVDPDLVPYVRRAVDLGVGELLVTAVDREGTRTGLDTATIDDVAHTVDVPVVAHGGAGTPTHIAQALSAGAAAVACGSMFVFHGPHQAVLITYLDADDRLRVLDEAAPVPARSL